MAWPSQSRPAAGIGSSLETCVRYCLITPRRNDHTRPDMTGNDFSPEGNHDFMQMAARLLALHVNGTDPADAQDLGDAAGEAEWVAPTIN
jgi:hypothetical protein